uniref:uncharacterized protein LOC120328903 n=1 Tax=Styela clava TaxID=7725 RepID=UPI001939AA8F|nr:uncharacterized protein LOC120328903 [Styela clava]
MSASTDKLETSNLEFDDGPKNSEKNGGGKKKCIVISGISVGAVVLFSVIFFPVYFTSTKPKPAESTIIITVTPPTTPRPWIYESERVDCSPDKNITKAECEGRGCVYSDGSPSVPTCFFSGPRLYSKDGDTVSTETGNIRL